MKWIEALKIWNAEHNPGKWCVARKGSAEYDQVKAIMNRGKEAAAAPAKKGYTKAEIMERIKAKKAGSAKKAIDESDALIAEIDAFLKGETKAAPSVPKAPTRNVAAETAYINKIAAEHAERYKKEGESKTKVKAFLKAAIEKMKAKKAAKKAEPKNEIVEEDYPKTWSDVAHTPIPEALKMPGFETWGDWVIHNWAEPDWRTPLLPRKSTFTTELMKKYPKMPKEIVNKIVNSVNSLRLSERKANPQAVKENEKRRKAKQSAAPKKEEPKKAEGDYPKTWSELAVMKRPAGAYFTDRGEWGELAYSDWAGPDWRIPLPPKPSKAATEIMKAFPSMPKAVLKEMIKGINHNRLANRKQDPRLVKENEELRRMEAKRSVAPSKAPARPEAPPAAPAERARSTAPLKAREATHDSAIEKAAKDAFHAAHTGHAKTDKHDFVTNFVYFSKMPFAQAARLFSKLPLEFTKEDLARVLATL